MTNNQVEAAYDSFKLAVLRHCNPPEEEWLFYKRNMHWKIFKKGEFLLQPGQPSDIYAYIYKGIMKQYFLTEHSKEFITRFDCPLETSGDAATLWAKKPARQYIQSITDVQALVTIFGLLEQLRVRHPVWDTGGRSIAEIRFFEKCDREYELLSYSAEVRYKFFLKRHGVNSHNIPQKDIACYIGVTSSTLNRIIKNSEKKL